MKTEYCSSLEKENIFLTLELPVDIVTERHCKQDVVVDDHYCYCTMQADRIKNKIIADVWNKIEMRG